MAQQIQDVGCTPQDLDVVLEGADVQGVAGHTGLPFTFHPAFQNATVTLPDGRHADLVRARRETYPLPGANPVPHPGTLEDDLRRRDFSLNALALPVTPRGPGPLLDVVGGLDDLHARVLAEGIELSHEGERFERPVVWIWQVRDGLATYMRVSGLEGGAG